MDSDPKSPKIQQHSENQAPAPNADPSENPILVGYPPAVPVFGFVEPVNSINNYGGPQGGYPPPQAGYNPQSNTADGNYNKLYDPESQIIKNFSFSDQSIRRAFIRKVYSILMCQLMVTFGVVSLFVFHDATKIWAQNNIWLLFGTMITIFVSTLMMSCFEKFLRKTPTNFMFLGFFTVCVSILVGYVCTVYDPETVIMAVGITTLICLALTLFALQTKYDFTAMGGILLTALLLLLLTGIVSIIYPDKTLKTVYSACGAMLFACYLIYDTQLMVGGDHKYSISPEDYIFASINIYLDIINLFLYILRILGSKK